MLGTFRPFPIIVRIYPTPPFNHNSSNNKHFFTITAPPKKWILKVFQVNLKIWSTINAKSATKKTETVFKIEGIGEDFCCCWRNSFTISAGAFDIWIKCSNALKYVNCTKWVRQSCKETLKNFFETFPKTKQLKPFSRFWIISLNSGLPLGYQLVLFEIFSKSTNTPKFTKIDDKLPLKNTEFWQKYNNLETFFYESCHISCWFLW